VSTSAEQAAQPEAAARHVTMARVGAPYGIKGWFRLHAYTEAMTNVLEYRQFRLRLPGSLSGASSALDGTMVEIDEARPHGNTLVAHIVGFDTPEAIRELGGAELLLPAGQLPALEGGEYYWHELIGLQVVTTRGQCLGQIEQMLETGANDVLVVVATDASIDDERRLLPYLPEQVVQAVDLDAGVMTVDWDPAW
jgi:16S rRNA processing protein RimM